MATKGLNTEREKVGEMTYILQVVGTPGDEMKLGIELQGGFWATGRPGRVKQAFSQNS